MNKVHASPGSAFAAQRLLAGHSAEPEDDAIPNSDSLASIEQLQLVKQIPAADLTHQRFRAAGGFGTVFEAAWQGRRVAVKAMKQPIVPSNSAQEERAKEARVTPIMLDLFTMEMSLASQLSHKNIIKVMGYVLLPGSWLAKALKLPAKSKHAIDPGATYLATVLELAELSLHEAIRRCILNPFRQQFTRRQGWNWLKQIVSALLYLHTREVCVIHRDLKPANILIMPGATGGLGCIKICDFGMVSVVREGNQKLRIKDIIRLTAEDYNNHTRLPEQPSMDAGPAPPSGAAPGASQLDDGAAAPEPADTSSQANDGSGDRHIKKCRSAAMWDGIAASADRNELSLCLGSLGAPMPLAASTPQPRGSKRASSRSSIDRFNTITRAASGESQAALAALQSQARCELATFPIVPVAEGVEQPEERSSGRRTVTIEDLFDALEASQPERSGEPELPCFREEAADRSPDVRESASAEQPERSEGGPQPSSMHCEDVQRSRSSATADKKVMFNAGVQSMERSLKDMKRFSKSMSASFIRGRDRRNIQSLELTGHAGTLLFMAPEVFKEKSYSASCDVFSFAMVAWELLCKSLLCLEVPECGTTEAIVNKIVYEDWRPPLPPRWPADLRKLLKKCWHDDPLERPTCVQILDALVDIEEEHADWIDSQGCCA